MVAKKRTANGDAAAVTAKKPRIARSPSQARASTHAMRTRAITLQEVRDPVLSTAELLENIILQLPIPDIVSARLVSKAWNKLVATSPQICRKIFIYPEIPTNVFRYDSTDTNKETFVLRPTDERGLSSQAISAATQDALQAWKSTQWPMRPVVLNPVLFSHESDDKRGTAKDRAYLCETIRFKFPPRLALASRRNIWMAMLICQPPVHRVTVTMAYHVTKPGKDRMRFPLQHVRFNLHNPRGVTLNNVMQMFLRAVPSRFGALRTFPREEYRIEAGSANVDASALWAPGAIFVNKKEMTALQRQSVVGAPSPLVRDMAIKGHCWWSSEDWKWVEAQDGWVRGIEGTKVVSSGFGTLGLPA